MNKGLSPFLTGGTPGLDSGFMGAQVTASALLAEMRSRAIPVSGQSVPTNGNNQDTVSMGSIAARRCAEQLDDLFRILAIEALALAQAFDLSVHSDQTGFSAASRCWHSYIRDIYPIMKADKPLASVIELIAQRWKFKAAPCADAGVAV